MLHILNHFRSSAQKRFQSAVRFAMGAFLAFVPAWSGVAGEAKVDDLGLPKDTAPLPPALQAKMKVLIEAAQKYRGLKAKTDVPSGSVDEATLKKKMVQALQEELPIDKMSPLEVSLKAFGLIPDTMVLGKYYPELLTSQVGGYYDPRRKYLVIVEREGGILGKEARAQYGEAAAARMEETVLVHELTHALQDQYFDLQKFTDGDPLADETAAHLALVEGDATLNMYDYFLSMNIENLPGLETVVGQLVKDPKQMIEMSGDMPGGKEMAAAPAWFRDNMLFSYLQGFIFCVNVRKAGGQKLLDYAFSKDPPRSTEQILHPEKWHTNRDDPIEITWPDLTKQLAGYTKVKEGQLGEQSIRILLREALKNEPVASAAAAGWGGDRFCVYTKDGKRVLAWITDWDNAKDANEFSDAARRLGNDWTVSSPAPRRVTVVRGALEPDALKDLQQALAAAKASQPENKNIDFAALHITASDAGTGDLSLDKLTDMLNAVGGDRSIEKGDPKGGAKSGGKDVDLDGIIDQLTKNQNGDPNTDNGMDLGSLLKNPAVKSMVKGMLDQERPEGKLSTDGASYTNDAMGFSIHAPTSEKGWKVDPKPPIPMASVAISSPDQMVQIGVISQSLPFNVPIENIAPFIEMGPKMAMQNYKNLGSKVIKNGSTKGLELEYEGDADGARIHALQRVFLTGSGMLVLSAASPATAWDTNKKATMEALDSFKFTAASGSPDAQKKKASPDDKEPLKEIDDGK